MIGGRVVPDHYNSLCEQFSIEDFDFPDVLNQSKDLLRTYNSRQISTEADRSSSLGFFYDKYKRVLNQKFVKSRVKKLK